MFFLPGEKVRANAEAIGDKDCPVCQRSQTFIRVEETVWFTLFMIPIAPMEKQASYDQCGSCQYAFAQGDYREPAHLDLLREVLVYMLCGYGMHQHRDLAQSLCRKLTGFDFPDDAVSTLMRQFEGPGVDMPARLESRRASLNLRCKEDLVRAAFLVAYASCELEYEDRLRINLMGTALGFGLETTDAVIAELRRDGYLGIRRYLPTQSA